MSQSLDALSSLATILASGVAVYGIRSWAVEARGRRKLEIAEETLAAFYCLKDEIASIREPGWFGFEARSRDVKDSETKEESIARDQFFVTAMRLKQANRVFEKLYEIRYRYWAVFGRKHSGAFEDILGVRAKIWTSARMVLDIKLRSSQILETRSADYYNSQIEKHERIVYRYGEGNDEILEIIERAIRSIEQPCLAVIRPREAPPENFWRSLLSGYWWR